jgi:WbqC-like protein family
MRVAIVQSSYIPWKGYFDLIRSVDRFVFYDDVQFTIRDWRTRNRIKTPQGLQWLSIPAGGSRHRLIHDVTIDNTKWQRKHWQSIHHSYAKTHYFRAYSDIFESAYLDHHWRSLSELNQFLTRMIATDILGIQTEFRDSREFRAEGRRQDRLIHLLQDMGATHYVSGPSAQNYIDPVGFAEAGINLEYQDYSRYPEYPQLHPPFEHAVSILDLVFNVGSKASDYIWGWRGH